jgi:hypothetical protein
VTIFSVVPSLVKLLVEITVVEPSELSVDSPELSVDSSDLSEDSPELSVNSSDLAVDSPDISVDSPGLSVDSPELSVDSPGLFVDSPEPSVDLPEFTVDSPELSLVPSVFLVGSSVVSVDSSVVSIDLPLVALPPAAFEEDSLSGVEVLDASMNNKTDSVVAKNSTASNDFRELFLALPASAASSVVRSLSFETVVAAGTDFEAGVSFVDENSVTLLLTGRFEKERLDLVFVGTVEFIDLLAADSGSSAALMLYCKSSPGSGFCRRGLDNLSTSDNLAPKSGDLLANPLAADAVPPLDNFLVRLSVEAVFIGALVPKLRP